MPDFQQPSLDGDQLDARHAFAKRLAKEAAERPLVLVRGAAGRSNDFPRGDGLLAGNSCLVAAPRIHEQLAAMVGPSLDAP